MGGPLDHCYHCKRKFGKECKRMDGLTFLCDTCLVKCRKCREMGFSRSGAYGKETKLFPHPEDLEGPREYCTRPGKGCHYIVCNKYLTDLGYRPLYLLNKTVNMNDDHNAVDENAVNNNPFLKEMWHETPT